MTAAPRTVWAMLSYRAGENSQILGLAEALRDIGGLDFTEKRLRYRRWRFIPSLLRRSTFLWLDLENSDALQPPWPDLLISAGLKNEPAARRIEELSGGKTKLVFLGRTWSQAADFDLIVATPQYRLTPGERVLVNPATITRVTANRLHEARSEFSGSIADLPGPRRAVLIGGQSGSWCFGKAAARRLAQELRASHEREGGSFLITTSSRTDHQAAELLEKLLEGLPARIHLWHRDGRETNPYFGFLALADEIVVTGDSIAMLSEALLTGKPVRIFDLGTGHLAMKKVGEPAQGPCDQNWPTLLYRFMSAVGPRRLSRDLALAHEGIIATGQASWLGEIDARAESKPLDVRPGTVKRILEILES